MNPQRWQQIEDLLQRALDLEPASRASFLENECGTDTTLRLKVEALLSHEARAKSFMESPALQGSVGQVQPALTPASKISHYRIETQIGEGGMGEVYRASDEDLRRTVALKMLPAEFTSNPARVQRFEQEAFAASRLNHPNIITIFEITHSDGGHFIVEEYVEGQTLRELLTDPQTKNPQKLEIERAIDIAVQIASALKAAHTAWIIHRDIKPENIMVREDGLVKVLDFGIAKLSQLQNEDELLQRPVKDELISTEESRSQLTSPGAIMGTASYMSPEQARGEQLDGRTDLFSLGLLLYEMVVGERLLVGATPALRATQNPGEALANVRFGRTPKELQRIIRKALRGNRDERYGSAGDMLEDLKRLRRRMESRTARRVVGLSALVVLATLAFAALAAFLSITEVWEETILRDGHTAAVRRAVFSPDGRLLVSAGEDRQVIVWDFARRERLKTFTDHTDTVNAVAFSPNGKWFATASEDQTIIVWDAARLEKFKVLRDHRGPVRSLTFSSDSHLMVSSSTDGEVTGHTLVWETDSWSTNRRLPFGQRFGNLIIVDNNQRLLDIAFRTWDLTNGQKIKVGPEEWAFGWLAISPDSKHLANVDSIGDVQFIDRARPEPMMNQHSHDDHGRSAAFSPDGRWVATAAERILLWDARTFQKVVPLEYESIVWSVDFSPDSRWLVSAHGDGAVLVWDVQQRELVANLREHSGGVRAVAFSPDGRRIATASEDKSIIIWDGEQQRKEAVLYGHNTRVTGAAFSQDGDWLVSVDQVGNLIKWDLARRVPGLTIKAPKYMPGYCVVISPDGRNAAATWGVFDLETGRSLVADPHWHGVYSAAFSADGKKLVGVTDQGEVVVVDTQNWQVQHQKWSDSPLVALSLSPDNKHIVTGEDAKVIRFGSIDPVREEAVIGQHQARIKSVAFSPDGKQVASAGDDKTIALWDVGRRKLLTTIGTHTSPIYSIAFSPDGQRLISGEHDRSVRIYTRHRKLWGYRLN
jgi:WD40 repeat protein